MVDIKLIQDFITATKDKEFQNLLFVVRKSRKNLLKSMNKKEPGNCCEIRIFCLAFCHNKTFDLLTNISFFRTYFYFQTKCELTSTNSHNNSISI